MVELVHQRPLCKAKGPETLHLDILVLILGPQAGSSYAFVNPVFQDLPLFEPFPVVYLNFR